MRRLSSAFAAFDAVRRERTQWFVRSSRDGCDLYEWANEEIGMDPQKCHEDIKTRSHKIWYFDIEGMLCELNMNMSVEEQLWSNRIEAVVWMKSCL